MSARRAKKLRQFLKDAELPESALLRNTRTGQILRGKGHRAVYQKMKKATDPAMQRLVTQVLQVMSAPNTEGNKDAA